MKKYQRLPLPQRRQEIQEAALALFCQKGCAATTMENIVDRVSLSKGGVYRIYSSTAAILEDLILAGMRMRNDYYEEKVLQALQDGIRPDLPFLVDMIGDSLLLWPEHSRVYVEFLWEKQRNPQLQQLYDHITAVTVRETAALIQRCSAGDLPLLQPDQLGKLAELMNAGILSLHVLGLQDSFLQDRDRLKAAICMMLTPEIKM